VLRKADRGRARLAGRFPALEDELAGLTIDGGYEPGSGSRSPDRADAMVSAMSALIRPRPRPACGPSRRGRGASPKLDR
jgi:phage terminase large subunit-like protein